MASFAPFFRLLPCLCFFLAACAATGHYPAQSPDRRLCADLVRLPQDLTVYARQAGPDKVLLPPAEQAAQAAKARSLFFAPWRQKSPGSAVGKALRDNFSLRPEKGFMENLRPFTPEAWAELEENASAAGYPSRADHAITVRAAGLRGMPTNKPYFLNPDLSGEGYPFDYFQHTTLWTGTPVFLSHISHDGQWVLAETRTSMGWMPAADAAVVDEDFERLWQSRPLAAITRDKVLLLDKTSGAPPQSARGNIGALLPLASAGQKALSGNKSDARRVFYPRRGADGRAYAGVALLAPEEAALFPLPLTPKEMAKVGNVMLGQPYGWGGLLENRDCSALTRDLLLPFGLWLPRNSGAQAGQGRPADLKDLAPEDKAARIAAEAAPFFSLLWLPGHIALYLGEYEGEPVIFHSLWGLRVRGKGPGGGRAVIGKACVTGLRPGAELPDISTPNSILDRMERIVLLPAVEKKPALAKAGKKSAPKRPAGARSARTGLAQKSLGPRKK
ncbi:MAG: SH3 domain-containing protein [Deltaproteobacteria bacterium]|jgi:cell wall-associated NlpC family hydrolase|nr:SH3 domain-containing protein [Deltaproteobacteria bacterium]